MICPYCHSSAVANQSEPLRPKCCACLRQWTVGEDQPDILTRIHSALMKLRCRNLDIHGISMSIQGWSEFERWAQRHVYMVTRRFDKPIYPEYYGHAIIVIKDQREPFLFMVKA